MSVILEYIKMDGKGYYVWSAYLITFILLAIMTINILMKRHIIKKKFKNIEKIIDNDK